MTTPINIYTKSNSFSAKLKGIEAKGRVEPAIMSLMITFEEKVLKRLLESLGNFY